MISIPIQVLFDLGCFIIGNCWPPQSFACAYPRSASDPTDITREKPQFKEALEALLPLLGSSQVYAY